jgi:hypothetical protein
MTSYTIASSANANVRILEVAELLCKSEDRRKVFKEIYRGKSSGKTAEEVASRINLTKVRVLQEALILHKARAIKREKIKGRLKFQKDEFISLHKKKILRLATNKLSRDKFRAKIRGSPSNIVIKVPSSPKSKRSKLPILKEKSSVNKVSKKIKILFLAANPKDTVSLRLDEEFREIENRILVAQKKEQFILVKKGAVRVSDLQLYLNQERPTIVHFSGHGTSEGKLMVEDNNGEARTIPSKALARVFKVLKDNVRCVVLNACFSLEQAHAINQNIDCVIGMSSSISDKAAIAFAYAFYLGLASERSIKNAFDQGITELMLWGIPEDHIPQLLCRDKIDPSSIFLLQ